MRNKKLTINTDPFDDIHVIGINTTLPDYKLAWHINQLLQLNLRKFGDIVPGQVEEDARYAFYFYDQGENMNVFNLVSINDKGLRWLKLPVTTDFLLVVRNPIEAEKTDQMVRSLKSIPHVVHAFLLEQSKIKGIDPLLEEIELYEFETQKSQNKRYPRK